MKTIKSEILLYGTKGQTEDLLSTKPEDFFVIMMLAKRDGFKTFRIVDYTMTDVEFLELDFFVQTLTKKK